MTHAEDLLSDALHGRADGRELPSTPLGDVVSTARRIQRRRRARTGVVTVAVLAVLATPFAVAATRGTDASPGPADPPSTDATPRVRLADVALGEPPAVAWLDGSDYVSADGTRTTLPLEDVTRATPYRDGFLVTVYGDEHVTLLDSELGVVWRRCTTGGLAVSADGLRTAYTTAGCGGEDPVLHVGQTYGTGDEQTAPMPLADGWPVGFVGDDVAVSSLNTHRPALVGPDGSSTPVSQLSVVVDADERLGLLAGQLAGGARQQLTGGVVDAATGSVAWSKPGWQLQAFSPDGSMVVGVTIGSGSRSIGWGVFDARTGAQLHEFATPAGFGFRTVAWEDDEHVLMTATQDGTEAILRTTLDGAIQRATDAVPYDDDDRRFGLAPNDFP